MAPAPLPVVVQSAFVGDVVLSLGLVRAAARTSDRAVIVVTRPATAPLFASDPCVERIISFDKHGADAGPTGLGRVARHLREALAGRPALALLPQGSLRSALLALRAGIPRRITFDDAAARWLCTELVPRGPHRPWDELALLGSSSPGGPMPHPDDGRLHLRPEELSWGRVRVEHLPSPRVALCPGSARGNKALPPALTRALTRRLVARGAGIVLAGGGAEREVASRLAASTPDLLDTTGQPLRAAAAILAACDLVLAADSGLFHLGAAVGTPALALHGPTPLRPFERPCPAIPGARHGWTRGLSCAPCSPSGAERCPLGHHGCMQPSSTELDALMDRFLDLRDAKVLHT